jgi:hypothetical protein
MTRVMPSTSGFPSTFRCHILEGTEPKTTSAPVQGLPSQVQRGVSRHERESRRRLDLTEGLGKVNASDSRHDLDL